MKQTTKAHQLLRVAYATYRRNEPDIAKDIFVLAMEDATAAAEFGTSRDELQARMNRALAAGDYDGAADQLQAMQEMYGEEPLEGEEEQEAALSPGDFVEPVPAPELAPAQVASLVTLARKIKADGHADLAGRITKALGL